MIKPIHSPEPRTLPSAGETIPPLENGDHLDQKTFHERYEAMPREQRRGGQARSGVVQNLIVHTYFILFALLSTSCAGAADKPIQIAPKDVSVAADTVAVWLQKLEGQAAETIRKDFGPPTRELEWKVEDKTHPKLEYRITDRTKVHVMLSDGKVFKAYALSNTSTDPAEKTATGVPRDIQQAAQALSKWAAGFDGNTRARIGEKLGPPTKTSDWDFMDVKHPQLDYQMTRQSTLQLYFIKDRVITAMIGVRSPRCAE